MATKGPDVGVGRSFVVWRYELLKGSSINGSKKRKERKRWNERIIETGVDMIND